MHTPSAQSPAVGARVTIEAHTSSTGPFETSAVVVGTKSADLRVRFECPIPELDGIVQVHFDDARGDRRTSYCTVVDERPHGASGECLLRQHQRESLRIRTRGQTHYAELSGRRRVEIVDISFDGVALRLPAAPVVGSIMVVKLCVGSEESSGEFIVRNVRSDGSKGFVCGMEAASDARDARRWLQRQVADIQRLRRCGGGQRREPEVGKAPDCSAPAGGATPESIGAGVGGHERRAYERRAVDAVPLSAWPSPATTETWRFGRSTFRAAACRSARALSWAKVC